MQRYSHALTGVRLPQVLKWLLSRPLAHSWIAILLAADLAALGDAATGPDVWFGPVYLLVICLAAWCRGWRAGLVVGLGCMAATLMINGARLYPFAHAAWAGNLVARLSAICIIIAVVAGARSVFIREWWMARTDPLTGAFNRQALFELGEELAAENSWRLLVYADLDGLKQINDRNGHVAGDRALVAFATAMRNAIRRSDLFARVGGDEFVIFMCVRDRLSAEAVAARLHRGMNSISPGGSDLRCSVGALVVPPGLQGIDNLVRVADTLMYQAKLRGAGLQLQTAAANDQVVATGRARKASRMPDAEPAPRRDLPYDRRGMPPPVPVAGRVHS